MTDAGGWRAEIEALCGGSTLADMHRYLAGRKWEYLVHGYWSDDIGTYQLDIKIAFDKTWHPVYGGWDHERQQHIDDPLEALGRALLDAVERSGE